MSESGASSVLDALASHKYGLGKNVSIERSSSAIVSIAASALLVRVLFRSRDRFNTTYHRLLLGLSISDILFSVSFATFGAVVPSELSYAVWNARGNKASCDAFGFLNNLGAFSGILYMCSLNLYYLSKVKFHKTDFYVKKRLEPWLHGVPILFGLIFSIVIVAKQGINANINGTCNAHNSYEPPHCVEHEDGDIPDGFEIPCGRGKGTKVFKGIVGLITLFLAPIIIGCSLWMIYRSVLRAEQVIARYGAGNNQDSFQSRTVLYRAAAYSVAYALTWIWSIVWSILSLAGVPTTEYPLPKWQIAYAYAFNFFPPLQGLWTFLIYMQPCVVKRKRSSNGNISWIKAFVDALWLAVNDGNNPPGRGRRRARESPAVPRTAATPGAPGTNASLGEAVHVAVAGLATDLPPPSAPGHVQSTTQEETLAVLRAMNANIVKLTAALEGREQRSPPRAERSTPLATCPEGDEEKAEIESCPHDGGQDKDAISLGTSAPPPPAATPGAGGPMESGLSSYQSAEETAPAFYFSTRETLSSYVSTRETLSSYFSTRETLSSYYSASEAKSDSDDE